MKHVTIDPVTRIEGHLRVEMTVDEGSGKVTDALSSGTAWRGLELIMNGRDPRDAWAYIQRICGVCTTAHALASVRAVEDALGIKIPKNANYIRNIMAASLTVQDHIVHFYHLHALDWVSPVEALKADPAATANLQNTVLNTYQLPFRAPDTSDTEAYPKEFPEATPAYFKAIKDKVQAIVSSGQLGIFAAQWWDHPDYQLLPPEVHLMAVAHYLEMLDKQRELVTPHVVFGGKNPHPHYVVGGMPCSISLEDGNAPVKLRLI
jgi:hydrogenase large subunit